MLTLIYVDEEEFFTLGPNDKVPLRRKELSVEDAVAFSRSEEGMSTAYMEAALMTREEAGRFSVACYMEGMDHPPEALLQEDGTYSVFLWDELGK